MRFHLGAIPESEDFDPSEPEWTSLKEPGPILAQVGAVPILVVTFVVTLSVLVRFTDFSIFEGSWLGWILVLVLLVPVHELVHAAFHPGRGRSPDSVLGFWPATFLFYAQYLGPIPRNRFIVVLLAPFVVLTVAPVSAGCLVGEIPWWTGVTALVNSAASCVDLLGVLILLRISPRSMVRNKGWKSYWKLGSGSSKR